MKHRILAMFLINLFWRACGSFRMRAARTIVAEVSGLFIKHSPERMLAILVTAEKNDANGLQLAAHSLKSSSACIGAMRLDAPRSVLPQTPSPAQAS